MREQADPLPSRHAPTARGAGPSQAGRRESARERFLRVDRYRVEREWKRYEGTAQRDLFRQLRERFLARHSVAGGHALEVGPGPGRFSPFVGSGPVDRVLLELSREMLRAVPSRWSVGSSDVPLPSLVQGDAIHPPFRPGTFGEVVALGNPLGFSEDAADAFLDAVLSLVAPGGTLVLETVAGPGERATYLSRLPPGAVRRLLAAPLRAVLPRVEREGFRPEPPARGEDGKGFRRFGPDEVRSRLARAGFETVEVMAVAPCLGFEPSRLDAVRPDPTSWDHLLDLEETIGRRPARQDPAAALLLAAVRLPGGEGRRVAGAARAGAADVEERPGGPGSRAAGSEVRRKSRVK